MVEYLKKAIKAKKPITLKDVEADMLQLFLAKATDNKWLSSRLEDVKTLKKGGKTDQIVKLLQKDLELHAEDALEDVLNGMVTPSTGQIHVLVPVPLMVANAVLILPNVVLPETIKLNEPEKFAQECVTLFDWGCAAEKYITRKDKRAPDVHQIPTIWKFMNNLGGCTKSGRIFWRTEEKKIAALVVDGWFRDSSLKNVNPRAEKRSIVIGSPGIGKLTVLCVMAFYLVLKHHRNVLVYRQLPTNENCLFYLGYEKSDNEDKVMYFTVPRCNTVHAIRIYEPLQGVWLLLDKFRFRKIPEGLREFKMLATSQQVDLKPGERVGTYACLLPCWSKTDLFSMGRFIYKFTREDMKKRYFYSGGSVREFTHTTIAEIREAVKAGISAVGDVSNVLSNKFSLLSGDRIRHTFWKKNSKSFMSLDDWEQVIDSEYAVSSLSVRLKLDTLSTIYEWAISSGNGSLAGTVFKIYLHRLAADNRLKLHIAEYDPPTKGKPNDQRHLHMKRVQLKKGRPMCIGSARDHKDELNEWRDDVKYSYWFPRCHNFPNIDSIVKLESAQAPPYQNGTGASSKLGANLASDPFCVCRQGPGRSPID